MNTLLLVCLFTGLIHFAETSALAMRLAGVRTRQIASSVSFVNIAFLVSRLSNMFQAPLLGAMVDIAVNGGQPGFDWQVLGSHFRWIILAAFAGNLLGAFLIPSFAVIFTQAIQNFEKWGSIPKVLLMGLRPRSLAKAFGHFHLPSWRAFCDLWSLKTIPKTFLVINVLIVSIYTVGVLASLWAGAQLPQLRATAGQLSGIVNGIATILLVMLVDPTSAHITDQIIHNKRPEQDIKSAIFYLVLGRLFGTLILAQLIFAPATDYIKLVTVWVARTFGG